jgi:hypothetical protein
VERTSNQLVHITSLFLEARRRNGCPDAWILRMQTVPTGGNHDHDFFRWVPPSTRRLPTAHHTPGSTSPASPGPRRAGAPAEVFVLQFGLSVAHCSIACDGNSLEVPS